MKPLPNWLNVLISSCPVSGNGVHSWLFRTARQLHAHLSSEEIVRLLEAASANCGRFIPMREIEAAVDDAAQCAWRPGPTVWVKPQPAWPIVNQERRRAIIQTGLALADLWESSPVRIDWEGSRTEWLIDQLFTSNSLLCCGRSSSRFETKPREEWRGQLSALPLIVPSPMAARTGRTQDGRVSAHCLSNTGPRRFLVVEFDSGSLDEHAALLWHLAGFGPLTLAVHSGSKSLHGWFAVNGRPEDKLCAFMRYTVSLGADHVTWTRSQFVRMPDGRRENGKQQSAYYFNPSTIKSS